MGRKGEKPMNESPSLVWVPFNYYNYLVVLPRLPPPPLPRIPPKINSVKYAVTRRFDPMLDIYFDRRFPSQILQGLCLSLSLSLSLSLCVCVSAFLSVCCARSETQGIFIHFILKSKNKKGGSGGWQRNQKRSFRQRGGRQISDADEWRQAPNEMGKTNPFFCVFGLPRARGWGSGVCLPFHCW